jgi:hypothetical protein
MHPKILIDFPETYSFEDMRFHIRELTRDLRTVLEKVESLTKKTLSDSGEIFAFRNEFEGIHSLLVHITSHHASELFRLVHQTLNHSSQSILAEAFSEVEENAYTALEQFSLPNSADSVDFNQFLNTEICSLLSTLSETQQQIEHISNVQASTLNWEEVLERGVAQFSKTLLNCVIPQSQIILAQTVRLHYLADSTAAKQDEEWQILATPLYEDTHPHAHELDLCPRCGATLTSDDRTYDGSYCESCRTRWSQPTK